MNNSSNDSVKIFKVLADETRQKLIKILLQKNSYIEELAQITKLTPATISFHLKKIEDIGLVRSQREQYYVNYIIDKSFFEKTLSSFFDNSEDKVKLEIDRFRNKVISSFIKYGKLKSIPVQQKKRRIILEYILGKFDKNKLYPEKEVNEILAIFHHDYCTLRREMICEKLMERNNDVYSIIA